MLIAIRELVANTVSQICGSTMAKIEDRIFAYKRPLEAILPNTLEQGIIFS